MNKVYLFFITMFLGSMSAFAQCEEAYLDTCKRHLVQDEYVFIKSCLINNEQGNNEKVEFSYALLKGKKYEYYFDGFKSGQQEVIATLYNANHQKVASSYSHNNYFRRLEFECEDSGIYYMEFTFRDEEEFCGAAGLGFLVVQK